MKNKLINVLMFLLGSYYKLVTLFYRHILGHFVWIKKQNSSGIRESFVYYGNADLLNEDIYIVTIYCEYTFQFIMKDHPAKLKYFTTQEIIKCITEIPSKNNFGLDTVKFESAYLMKKNTNLNILDEIALYHTPNTKLTMVDFTDFTTKHVWSDDLTFSDIFF